MKIYYKFTIFALITLYFALLSSAAFAATVELEVPLPGLTGNAIEADPGLYINRIFVFGLSLAGFLAVAAMAYGGIQYMLAGASIGSMQQAKTRILGALGGIGLLLVSWLILSTIDPSLVKLTPNIKPLDKILKPKENTIEQVGVDYGRAETATTETFIYAVNQIGSQYVSQAGCERIASVSDYNACIAQKGCERLGADLSAKKGQKLISVKLENGKCRVTLEKKL